VHQLFIGPVEDQLTHRIEIPRACRNHDGRLAIPSPPAKVATWPLIGSALYDLWNAASVNIEAAFKQLAPYLKPAVAYVLTFAGGAGLGILKFLLSVVLSGFLLVTGPRIVEASRNLLSHVIPERSDHFLSLAAATIRSVSLGVIGIAMLQALLTGAGLKLIGMTSASILAFAVLIFGILQIGSAIILFPVIIWIWSTRDFSTALPMTIFLGCVGLADNVLKPLLMGRGLTTPILVIFIGVMGGTLAHGIVGLFVGPIVLAVAWELLLAWISEKKSEFAGIEQVEGSRKSSAG